MGSTLAIPPAPASSSTALARVLWVQVPSRRYACISGSCGGTGAAPVLGSVARCQAASRMSR
eukprot:3951544-Pyramimonas_sp.AAC.1